MVAQMVGRPARLNSLTLAFDNPDTEKAYLAHRCSLAVAADRFKLGFVGVISIVNLTIAAWTSTSGDPLSWRLIRAVVPHSLVFGCHMAVSYSSSYRRHRSAIVLLCEMLYIGIGVFNLPSAVVSAPTSVGSYAKSFILGSGVLLGLWYSGFSDKPWRMDMVLLPMEYCAFAWLMAPKACAALTSNDLGLHTTKQLLTAMRSSHDLPLQQQYTQQPGTLQWACCTTMYTWVGVWCVLTLYGRYRLDLRRRMAFSPGVSSGWPGMPPVTQLVLHAAVAMLGMSWLLL